MIITVAEKPRQKSFPNYQEYQTFTNKGIDNLIDRVFSHYRKQGFLYYPTDLLYRLDRLEALSKSDYVGLLEEGNRIRQSMAGLSLAWSYMPHSFGVRCRNMRTPLEAYEDDVIFKKVIHKVIKMKHPITMSGIRKTLKIFSGTQGVSNFRPTAAACIYHHFDCKGKTVWDMSCGYGGRLLGANLVGVEKYIGTEPCHQTMAGLKEMVSELISIRTELHQCGSEDYVPEPESIDFCFTSPPYFNTEQYSTEDTQSWVRHPTKEEWRVGFLKKTFENCFKGLKPNGKMLINIANVKTYPNLEEDTIRTAKEVGFEHKETWKLSLSSLPVGDIQRYKYEPIFVFQKGVENA